MHHPGNLAFVCQRDVAVACPVTAEAPHQRPQLQGVEAVRSALTPGEHRQTSLEQQSSMQPQLATCERRLAEQMRDTQLRRQGQPPGDKRQ